MKDVEVEIDVVVIQCRRNLPSLPPSTPSSVKLFVPDDSTEDQDIELFRILGQFESQGLKYQFFQFLTKFGNFLCKKWPTPKTN